MCGCVCVGVWLCVVMCLAVWVSISRAWLALAWLGSALLVAATFCFYDLRLLCVHCTVSTLCVCVCVAKDSSNNEDEGTRRWDGAGATTLLNGIKSCLCIDSHSVYPA